MILQLLAPDRQYHSAKICIAQPLLLGGTDMELIWVDMITESDSLIRPTQSYILSVHPLEAGCRPACPLNPHVKMVVVHLVWVPMTIWSRKYPPHYSLYCPFLPGLQQSTTPELLKSITVISLPFHSTPLNVLVRVVLQAFSRDNERTL